MIALKIFKTNSNIIIIDVLSTINSVSVIHYTVVYYQLTFTPKLIIIEKLDFNSWCLLNS